MERGRGYRENRLYVSDFGGRVVWFISILGDMMNTGRIWSYADYVVVAFFVYLSLC